MVTGLNLCSLLSTTKSAKAKLHPGSSKHVLPQTRRVTVVLALTYGVSRRGERRHRSVRRGVERLLDFGADNPAKVNNRQGSINSPVLPSMEIPRWLSGPACFNIAHHIHLCRCMCTALGSFGGPCLPVLEFCHK